jgi:hypothetical protein
VGEYNLTPGGMPPRLRIAHATMPAADRYILDIGPSYVVVTALAVAVTRGRWLTRAAAETVRLCWQTVRHDHFRS